MPNIRRLAPSLALLSTALAFPAPTVAGAPDNDRQDSATRISAVPYQHGGDLRSAKLEHGEQQPGCASIAASVWYRVTPGQTRRLVARMQAHGKLDGALDVFEQERSSIRALTCDATDANGNAAVAFDATAGKTYLIRVARRAGAARSGFTLSLQAAAPPPSLPGAGLGPAGVGGTVDRLQRTAATWSARLRGGVRYRVSLTHPGGECLGGTVLEPHAELGDKPLANLGCEGYALITPRHSGRYSVLVRAAMRRRGLQRYHLQINAGGVDDSAPGFALGNLQHIHGGLDGLRTDRLDLYSFDVPDPSTLFLGLDTAAKRHVDLQLLTQDGSTIACACQGTGAAQIHERLHPGRFFVAVRARDRSAGAYSLVRHSALITKSHLSLASARTQPGKGVVATATINPAVRGPVAFVVEQRDPFSGWQFVRTVHAQAVRGVARAKIPALSEGHWRVQATYVGTRGTARSLTGFDAFTVAAAKVPAELADLG